MGVIYLLHLERSYRHARHYLGLTEDLDQRLATHRAGAAARLLPLRLVSTMRGSFQFAPVFPAARWTGGSRHRGDPESGEERGFTWLVRRGVASDCGLPPFAAVPARLALRAGEQVPAPRR
jgi:hypothetical protein